jgi:hypothetical protein
MFEPLSMSIMFQPPKPKSTTINQINPMKPESSTRVPMEIVSIFDVQSKQYIWYKDKFGVI